MASKTRLQVLIFAISLCNLRLGSSSSWEPIDAQTDFRKWVSWNVEHYREKLALQPQSIDGGGGNKARDVNLIKAEMNKVTVTVSQDGSADYATISDAIHSIPLHNNRRVILVIKPGVYRYVMIYIIPVSVRIPLYHFLFFFFPTRCQ